jgi:hypothetical protein
MNPHPTQRVKKREKTLCLQSVSVESQTEKDARTSG